VLNCLALFALWGVSLATGHAWERGLFAYQDGNVPVFHLVAELSMAVVMLVGLLAWWRRREWGPLLALVAAGMFGYSGVNSMGWALHNDPVLPVPMGLSVIGLAWLFPLVRRAYREGRP
jgi:branched-subunit amino acid permease